jgi:PAS domain S-box-containing protein
VTLSSSDLVAIQLEAVLALSGSLDVATVLRETLAVLAGRLGCGEGAIYAVPAPPAALRVDLRCTWPVEREIRVDAELKELGSLVHSEYVRDDDDALHHHLSMDGGERHLFLLPGFGVLELRKSGEALAAFVQNGLGAVLRRLGVAARACEGHAALVASERRYAALTATLPEMIFDGELDDSGMLRLDYASPRAQSVLGVSADALCANPALLFDALAEDEHHRVRDALAEARRTGEPFELVVRCAGDASAPRWMLLSANAGGAEAGGPLRWSGFLKDVTTSQRLAASEREAARLRFAALFTSVSDAIVGADARGIISHWNRGAELIFGHPASAVVGHPLSVIIPERLREAHAHGFARHIATGEAHVVGKLVELPALHADGSELLVELLINRVESGGEVSFVGILRDVTERRHEADEREREAAHERRLTASLLTIARHPADDLQAFKRHVDEEVATALGVDRVSVWRMVARTLECRDLFEAATRAHTTGAVLAEADFHSYFAALAAEESIDAPDACTHPATACFREGYLEPLGIHSMLDIPLRSLDGVRGVLCIETLRPRVWSPAEVRYAEEIGSLLVQAMEKAMRRRIEAQHEVVLASIADAVIACDPDGRVTLLNPMAESLTGLAAAQALGLPLADAFRALALPSRAPFEVPVAEVIATGAAPARSGDLLLVARDGTERPIALRVAAIVEDARNRGVVLTFRDVSAEEAAQRAIREQNQRLRALGEAIPDMLFSVGVDGTLRYSKQAASPDLLVAPAEIPAANVRTLFEPALAAQLIGAVEQAVASGQVQTIEYDLELPTGRQTFEARMARMSDDESTVLVRNVTAERARQAALEDERQRLAAVLDSTSAIIYVAALPDFRIEYISESVFPVLGFTREEFAAPGFWESAVHPDDWLRVSTGLPGLFEKGEHVHEYRHRTKDGNYRWLRDTVRLVRDDNGVPVRAVGASFDISERKLNERRLAMFLGVQRLVALVSAGFLGAHGETGDAAIEAALAGLGSQIDADRAYVFQLRGALVDNTHEWCSPRVAPQRAQLQGLPTADFEFFMTPIRGGSPLHIPSVADMPAESASERDFLAAQGISSLVAVPLIVDGELRGFLGVDNPRFEPLEAGEFAALMQLLADAITAGLQRVGDELALRSLNVRLTERTAQQAALIAFASELSRTASTSELLRVVRARVRAATGADHLSLVRRIGQTSRLRMFFVDLAPELGDLESFLAAGAGWIERREQISAEQIELDFSGAGSALLAALVRGVPMTTRDHAVFDFPDWRHLHAAHALRQFVIVPILGPHGPIGTLNLGLRRDAPPTPDEVDAAVQFGAVLGAHLAIQEGRDALQSLNAALEERVEERTRELRRSEERFERLFLHAPQAMLIVDGDRRVVQSNLNARSLFGYEPAEFDGLPVSRLVPAAIGARHEAMMDGFRSGPNARAMAPSRIVEAVRRDGTQFPAEIGLVSLQLSGERQVLAGIADVSARMAAQEEVTRSLREKETLLKEIHHRVKNNLQIISSLLMLQSEQMPGERARTLLAESVYRVRSMALIHQQLYGVESLERIDFGDYARSLADSLRAALSPGTRLEVHTEPVEVSVEHAVPLGLILNEFITNAIKYGQGASWPEGEGGRCGPGCDVRVEVLSRDGRIHVAVVDSGPGLPQGFSPTTAGTLGMQLVRSLTRQLRGQIVTDYDRGMRFEVHCALVAVD